MLSLVLRCIPRDLVFQWSANAQEPSPPPLHQSVRGRIISRQIEAGPGSHDPALRDLRNRALQSAAGVRRHLGYRIGFMSADAQTSGSKLLKLVPASPLVPGDGRGPYSNGCPFHTTCSICIRPMLPLLPPVHGNRHDPAPASKPPSAISARVVIRHSPL